MNLTVANVSTQINAVDFQAAINAIVRQVREHFQPEWNATAALRGVAVKLPKNMAPINGHHDAIIYLGDSSQDPTTGVEGALGYHSVNHVNVPYGFVYLDICAQYGESWQSCLSHEVLELLADPTAVMTVTGPTPRSGHGTVHYDLEVCDPTQGDSYRIDNVEVSNFVGRAYFGLTGGSGATNYLSLELQPFGVRPKGYFQYEDRKGGVHQVEGEKVTDQIRSARSTMAKMYGKLGPARRNARREARAKSGL